MLQDGNGSPTLLRRRAASFARDVLYNQIIRKQSYSLSQGLFQNSDSVVAKATTTTTTPTTTTATTATTTATTNNVLF